MDDDSVITDRRPDHSRTPVLEALERYRRSGRHPFSPPGHKGGPGVDARVALTLGPDVFASDVLALNGLDDRRMSGRVLERAEELMADAVDADRAAVTRPWNGCGSTTGSISVSAACTCRTPRTRSCAPCGWWPDERRTRVHHEPT
ncbi:hypothetical protein [Streptomyces sp. NPDC002324]